MGILYVCRTVDHAHLDKLHNGKLGAFLVRHVPEVVTLVAEILQPDPDLVLRIRQHIGGPVVENLDSAQLYPHVLHIDPAVRGNVPQGLDVRLVDQVELVHQQAYGDKIPVGKPGGNFCNVGRHRLRCGLHAGDQILDGHGGLEIITGNGLLVALCVSVAERNNSSVVRMYCMHAAVHADFTAHFPDQICYGFPQLTGSEFGIVEFFDQRGFHLFFVAGGQDLAEHVLDDCLDGQALDPLCPPGCGDFTGMSAPELFGVALKEHGVQHLTETVDVEILQGGFFLLADRGFHIAASRLDGSGQSHILEGLGLHADGVVKEFFLVVDPGYPVAHQHNPVGFLRIRPSGYGFDLPAQLFVIIGQGTLSGHDFLPPFGDPGILREEPMSADVHTLAVILDRAGNTADGVAFLQNGNLVAFVCFQQFISRSQSGRTCADNYNLLHVFPPYRNIFRAAKFQIRTRTAAMIFAIRTGMCSGTVPSQMMASVRPSPMIPMTV